MPAKGWDVFISHASEDKENVARPLADALRRTGMKVWLDQQELEIGDSLSEKVDEGLSKSYFGVVILSKAFFLKHWPRRELAGLRSREEAGRKIILPVWHKVTKAEVSKFSPILADALAATTKNGIEKLADQISRVVFSPSSGSPSVQAPSLSRAMSNILESDSDRNVMVDFIRSTDRRLNMYNLFGPHQRRFDKTIGNITFDIVGFYTGHYVEYRFSLFSRIWKDPFAAGPRIRISKEVRATLSEMLDSKKHFEDHWRPLHSELLADGRDRGALYTGNDSEYWFSRFMEWKPNTIFQLFCGRRAAIDRTDAHTAAWGQLQKEHEGIRIRSYDAVLDAILEHEGRPKRKPKTGTAAHDRS
jgi:hypothetical protein